MRHRLAGSARPGGGECGRRAAATSHGLPAEPALPAQPGGRAPWHFPEGLENLRPRDAARG